LENVFKAMSQVFDSKTATEWFNYKSALVKEQDAHFIDDLKMIEDWGFLKIYKNRLHPTFIPQFLEIQYQLNMFKLVLISAIVKEFYQIPQP